jgi:hypothetical protein
VRGTQVARKWTDQMPHASLDPEILSCAKIVRSGVSSLFFMRASPTDQSAALPQR